MQILIPEDNVIWVLGLVQSESLHIGIYLFGLPIVSEDWLSGPQFIFVVEVVVRVRETVVVQGGGSDVTSSIVIKFLLIGRTPEDCTAILGILRCRSFIR